MNKEVDKNKDRDSNNSDPEKHEDSSKKEDTSNSEEDTVIPEELLEGVDEEDKAGIKKFFMSAFMQSRSGNPIGRKLTEQHISDIIGQADTKDKRDREERKNQRTHDLFKIGIGLLFIGFLVVFLQNNQHLLIHLIIAIISFIGGVGYGRTQKFPWDQ